MSDPFAILHQSLFASPLCEDVVFRGVGARAFVARNVEMVGDYGQAVGRRTMVELPSSSTPVEGDAIVIDTVAYVLDVLSTDDGQIARWIVRPAS